jgi:hypothetical protein
MREIKFRAWDEDKYRWCERGEILLTLDGDWRSNFGEHGTLIFSRFTGLHDKNGKEIYEGDVVQEHSQGAVYINEIRWSHPNSGFWVGGIFPLTKGQSELVEVVGNIYENPELLSTPPAQGR